LEQFLSFTLKEKYGLRRPWVLRVTNTEQRCLQIFGPIKQRIEKSKSQIVLEIPLLRTCICARCHAALVAERCHMWFSCTKFHQIWSRITESKKIEVKQSAPLPAWSGTEGSRNLRFPDSMTTAQYGGKVVSLKHRPPLPPANTPGTHFC
jgi:hypothetical protein